MRKNIAAFTETNYTGSYPAYISINREENNTISIIARERGHDGNKSVRMEISEEELLALAEAILSRREI